MKYRLMFMTCMLSAAGVSAGLMENSAASAEKIFFDSQENVKTVPMQTSLLPEVPRAIPGILTNDTFNSLRAEFELGTAPAKKELLGWFSGRLIFQGSDMAGGLLLVGFKTEAFPDEPMFAKSVFKLIAVLPDEPGAYDNPDKDTIASVRYLARTRHRYWQEPEFTSRSVTFQQGESSDHNYVRYEIRKSNGRMLVKYAWDNTYDGQTTAGIHYGFILKNVTPPVNPNDPLAP